MAKPKPLPLTERAVAWSQRMRAEGDDELANLLMSAEQEHRKAPRRTGKRKEVLYTRSGKRVELYRETVKNLETKKED